MDTLQIIAEPRRREILRLLWDAEMAAGEIVGNFDVTFGAVSQHLGLLKGAGLVDVRKEGNRRMYRVNRDALAPYTEILEKAWAESLERLAETIEREETQ